MERLSSIVEELDGATSEEFLGRAEVQRLFQVSHRQATRVLHRLGARTAGGALIISRTELLDQLRALARGEEFQYERRRRQRLAQQIEEARREARSRRVKIPPPPEGQGMEEFPAGIDVHPGKLEVRFEDPVELVQKLMQLAQMAASDWDSFQQRLAGKALNGGS